MSNPETIARIRVELAKAERYQQQNEGVSPVQMASVLSALRMLVDEIDPLRRTRGETTESKRR